MVRSLAREGLGNIVQYTEHVSSVPSSHVPDCSLEALSQPPSSTPLPGAFFTLLTFERIPDGVSWFHSGPSYDSRLCLSGVLFPEDSVSVLKEKVIWQILWVFSQTRPSVCALLLSARLWGWGGQGDAVISLKDLNLNVIQICSLTEFRPVIYKCPFNFPES